MPILTRGARVIFDKIIRSEMGSGNPKKLKVSLSYPVFRSPPHRRREKILDPFIDFRRIHSAEVTERRRNQQSAKAQ